MPPTPVRSPLDAVHRLSGAVLAARTAAEVTSALVLELRDKSGAQFDPQVVLALLERLGVPAISASAGAAS